MGTMWHSCTIKKSSEAQREIVASMCVLVHLENNVLSPHRSSQFRINISKGKNACCAGFVIKEGWMTPAPFNAARTYSMSADWNL